ncbi:hypothetical protein RHMOL_Rhmol11G0021700 [Rhododendron molle]|uniref:Uncharacterized protein n=1 Tax=Rhododendron molle TaxID=49168 RepID=A0ACC0LNX1_RHOML|nr:hypothetical protein RHMOL_Rhmol11G0021700 [Rhododendron molle]
MEIQPLRDGNIRAEIRHGRDHHAIHVDEDTRMADTIVQSRQKSKKADKEKGLLTYTKDNETSLVEPLRDRNVVVIHEERNVNVMRIREIALTPSGVSS